jgi:BatD DUF11 like domain
MKRRSPHVMILIGLALTGLLALPLCASAVDVSFQVQPHLMNLGETAKASLTFHGVRSAPGVEFPSIPGLQITGMGQQMQFGTGGSKVTQTYNIFPQKAGTYTIGPYQLDFQGEQLTIPAVSFEVRAPNGQAGATTNEMVFARIDLPKRSPTIHQVFDITLSLYFLPTVQLASEISLVGGFPESGFVIGGFEEMQTIREEVGGQLYTLRRFRARARALTAGTFTLEPALRVGIVDRNAPQNRDPFSGMFNDPFRRQASTPLRVAAPAEPLTIRPIPKEGRPADYSGAVGNFQFSMDVRPRELKVGEPITVKLQLRGMGNIASVIPPSYQDSDMFKAYEARQVGDTPDSTAERGNKIFEQVVIPRTDALKELPPLQFSFFNPDSMKYETASAGPFPLTVHPSENGSNALLLQVPGTLNGGGKALVLGSDIIYLKSAPLHWLSLSESGRRAWMKRGLNALPPFLLIGLLIATHRRKRLASDIALARRQKAPRSARANLRKAEAALKNNPTTAAVFSPLTAAALDYFGHRLNLPPGAVEASLILEKLKAAQASSEMMSQWQEFFALSDQIHYSTPPELSKEELSNWIPILASLLRQAERIQL